MTYSYYLKEKQNIQDALEKVMFDYLSKLSLEELKQIDWFTIKGFENEREQYR